MYHKFKPNEETLSLAHTYLRYIEGIKDQTAGLIITKTMTINRAKL
jgi:hypothetical protein